MLGTLCMFVARAAAKGAAAAAVAAAVVESLLVDGGVNGLGVAVAALAAKTCGRPFWWGAAAYSVIVVALGSESAQHQFRRTDVVGHHLDVVPRQGHRHLQRLHQRLLGGEPGGQRLHGQFRLGGREDAITHAGRTFECPAEPSQIDHVDPDAHHRHAVTRP